MQEILKALGLDIDSDGLKETAGRVTRMWHEMTQGYLEDPAKILATRFEADYDQMVVVKDIEFWSLCEHHMLPFNGVVHVGYLPKGQVVGLSKIPRLVGCFARRLQIQERMTKEIATTLEDNLDTAGVGVVIKASHTCMKMRGVRSSGDMVTSAMLGTFRSAPEVRAEFLAFLDR